MKFNFNSIQALGRALMLPIAVLPVAGLLLRFGQPDLLNIAAIADAGNAIFANLPMLFAIGVAIGFAKENNRTAALAGAVGFFILNAILNNINKDINMGVFGGIIIGLLAGKLYNKFHNISLPEYLSFFGGKRFVPIVTGLSAVVLGVACGYIWPPIQNGLNLFSTWMSSNGDIGLFLFGFFNRLLLATGLHHILNNLFWFQLGDFTNSSHQVVHGDIARFMAGDPTAGNFMAGFFPIMMFGLPAVCLAMYHTALPQNKKAVAGMLLSMALTSFLTGITEPIEYSFVFLAPVLYLLHATITGISMAVMYTLNVKLGFSFSAGLIDFVLFHHLSTNPMYALYFGALVFVIYYLAFSFVIRKFDLKTIGREESILDDDAHNFDEAKNDKFSTEYAYIEALGGKDNLKDISACTTRLRLEVVDSRIINQAKLKQLGAKGILTPSLSSVQVIIGPQAENISGNLREAIKTYVSTKTINEKASSQFVQPIAKPINQEVDVTMLSDNLLAALGGSDNIIHKEIIAITRINVTLKDIKKLDLQTLDNAMNVINFGNDKIQVYVGANAHKVVENLEKLV